MRPIAEFIELHNVDWEIHLLREEEKRIPQKLKKSQDNIKKSQYQLEQFEEKLRRQIVQIREQEKFLLSLEDVIKQRDIQLNQAKNNREYETLVREIKEKKEQKGTLEEEILKLLEQNEGHQAQIKSHKEKIVQLQLEHEHFVQETQNELRELTSRLNELQKQRLQKQTTIQKLAPDLLETYDRILQTNTGKALAPVEEEACGFCYLKLSANSLSILKGGKMIFCKQCERLLYIPLK